jgi:hypothetical protein
MRPDPTQENITMPVIQLPPLVVAALEHLRRTLISKRKRRDTKQSTTARRRKP